MTKEKMKKVIFSGETEYGVVCDAERAVPYGLYVKDEEDSACVEGVFFTEDEAVMRCKWLCENQVYPISLRDVFANIF